MEKYITKLIKELKSFGLDGTELLGSLKEVLNTDKEIEMAKRLMEVM